MRNIVGEKETISVNLKYILSKGDVLPWSSLIIRPVMTCNGSCIGCPWISSSTERNVLSLQLFDKLYKFIANYNFDEAVILCPNPYLHPKIKYFINKLRDFSRRLYILLPIKHIRNLTKNLIENIDELVIVVSNYIDLVNEERYIKALLSHGIEDFSIYLALKNIDINIESILSSISICRKYGLKLRIGEIPYSYTYVLDLQRFLIERGFEVSLPYGYLYGYRAYTAYIDNYRVTLLTKPLREECRKLYLDPMGKLYKCPFLSEYIDLNSKDISMNEIRRIMFSNCPIKYKLQDYIPAISISLVTTDGKIIPKDILELLEVLMHTKSFRTACELLGYKPSTYIEKIHAIEKKIGFKLIITSRGGYKRGITLLTPEALRLLEKYKAIREYISEKMFEGKYRNFII